MPFQTSYDAPNFFGGLSAIGQTLKQSQLESNRQAAFAGMQSGVPLSDISKALLGAGDTQAGLAVAQLAEAHAQHAATQHIAQQQLLLQQQAASPEFQARMETAKLQAAQPFEKPVAVQPGQILVQPHTGKTVFQNVEGDLSDEAVLQRAQQGIAGDQAGAYQGLAYRDIVNRQKITNKMSELRAQQGITGADQAAQNAAYGGTKAEARVISTRAAQLSIPMNAFETMAPLALEASQAVDRTKYPTLNSIVLAAKRGTGDENVVALHSYLTTLAMQYARATTPVGQSTDAQRNKAFGLFAEDYAKGQLATAIDAAHRDMAAEKGGVKKAKEEMNPNFVPKQYPTPTPEIIQQFRNNSAKRGEAQTFDEAFGPGAAARALRGQ